MVPKRGELPSHEREGVPHLPHREAAEKPSCTERLAHAWCVGYMADISSVRRPPSRWRVLVTRDIWVASPRRSAPAFLPPSCSQSCSPVRAHRSVSRPHAAWCSRQCPRLFPPTRPIASLALWCDVVAGFAPRPSLLGDGGRPTPSAVSAHPSPSPPRGRCWVLPSREGSPLGAYLKPSPGAHPYPHARVGGLRVVGFRRSRAPQADGEGPAIGQGLRHPSVQPYAAYETSGDPVLISVQNEREFRDLCGGVLGRPELASDDRFSSNLARCRNSAALDEVIREAPM